MMSLKEMVNMTTKLGIRFSKLDFWRKLYCCAQQSSIWDEYRGSVYKRNSLRQLRLSVHASLCVETNLGLITLTLPC